MLSQKALLAAEMQERCKEEMLIEKSDADAKERERELSSFKKAIPSRFKLHQLASAQQQ